MYKHVLSESQQALFPLLKKFAADFGLVGGTAIALQLGHRRSIDFDLFTESEFDSLQIRQKIRRENKIQQTIIESQYELTILVDGVKLTFYRYPYHLDYIERLENIISLPNLETLAAMKAFALGRRAKWKDYVDLYFLMQKLGFASVVAASTALFGDEFNEKLFRSQLTYLEDIDYSEAVDYLVKNPPTNEEVVSFLSEQAIS